MAISSQQQKLASEFRNLHTPENPVIVVNVWDAFSANAVASVPGVKALATASYAIASTYGVADNDMTFEQNLEGVSKIAPIALKHNLPLTVDLQDGYEDVTASIKAVIKLGAVGANIEDFDDRENKLRSKEDAVERIKTAVAAAEAAGLPEFCVNARTDVIGNDGTIEDAIDRGKAFLAAGANTVFVWGGGKRNIHDDEVKQLVEAFDGKLNVILRGPGLLSLSELKEIGVARISMGPRLQFAALEAIKKTTSEILTG